MTKLYRCFDNNLKEFLMSNGLRYLLICKDIVSDDKMWLFDENEEFNKYYKIWKSNSPKNK